MTRPDRLHFDQTANGRWFWRHCGPGGHEHIRSKPFVRKSAMIANAARVVGPGAIAGYIHLADQTHEWEWRQALQARYGQGYDDEYTRRHVAEMALRGAGNAIPGEQASAWLVARADKIAKGDQ